LKALLAYRSENRAMPL